MTGRPTWRQRKRDEAALREECRQLSYISAFWANARPRSSAELETLLARVIEARSKLATVIYGHDDSPRRVVVFAIGLGTGLLGLVGIAVAGPIGLVGFVLGAGLSLNEAAAIADTRITLDADGELLESLGVLQRQIADEMRRRGFL